MKLQTLLKSLPLMCFSSLALAADSGPSTGGGGFVISCRATSAAPVKLELLDLYEGKNIFGYQLVPPSGDLQQDYFTGVDGTYTLQRAPDLAEKRQKEISANLSKFMKSVEFVARPEDLPSAPDLGELPWIPSHCEILQVAYYDDQSRRVAILEPFWRNLDSLSKAALVHHELFYRLYREYGEKTSESARRMVARIYSKK